ncbi:unnamed protein product [Dimorphilus gyrociliatus]|uniref:Uncharacterized protein n=1 Tax=Dimorphilus gyrociliatus TaxID=2664684 RepID=A0A7I8VT06_9ANNE|nr:unnamed protein product [Dimorphilus gyrociliatus]
MPSKKRKKKKKATKKNSTSLQPSKGNEDEDEEEVENIVDPNQLKFIYSKCVKKVIQSMEEKKNAESVELELPLVCSYSGFHIELSPFPEIFAHVKHGKNSKFNEVLPQKSTESLPPITIAEKQMLERKPLLRTDTSYSNSTALSPSRRPKKATVNFIEDRINPKRTVTLPPIFALTRTQTTGTMNLS